MQPRLKTQYNEVVLPQLRKDFDYGNVMEVPKLEKIVLNTCLKEAITNMKILDSAAAEIGLISGQKPIITKARKSIANFKLREGMPLGAKVTLRGAHKWEFLDRLVAIAIPRIRDFRGLNPHGFDGRGNYSMGITEQIVFPEIEYDKVQRITGMNITFVTSANTDEEGRALLKALGMPFADL
jgi:large subunit ribosomal protein L5|tara:strand:- start:553 stop:1098 length:546 start_codon:yes stop_codon:yes gene_type:complete